jgi:RNA polymerase sigma factor (sigma-70 family)
LCDNDTLSAVWQHGVMTNETLLTTALPALTHTNRRSLVRAATRLLGPADAEDAVQDAYVRALEANLPELNSAQAWLLTVVRNLAIDRLRRRNWMQQWLLAEMESTDTTTQMMPSAEMDAALAQEVLQALRLIAAHLAPEDGAAVLLHAVFEVTHADIAQASGRSEASSRQQLRRALLRLRHANNAPDSTPIAEREPGEETVLRLYLQAMQLRDPRTLWAMLRHPPISALAGLPTVAAIAPTAPLATTSGVVQVGGQLGLVLTLDGVLLCVVPLGVHAECESI